MTPSELNVLRTELDNPTITVFRSVFRDHNGYWAKEWADVVVVYIETGLSMSSATWNVTPDEFKQLSRGQQTKVRNAPSSPLP